MTSSEIRRDFHVHTNFSDGYSSPEELIKFGIEKKIEQICFTDHYSFFKPAITDENFILYLDTIQNLKKKYSKKIQIFIGIEVDTSSIEDFDHLGHYPWDLILFEYVFSLPDWYEIFSKVKRFASNFPSKNVGFAHTRFSRLTHAKFEEVMNVIQQHDLIIELNTGYQNYLDPWFNYMDDQNNFSVGSDAHSLEQLGNINGGISFLIRRNISIDRIIEL
ncbi:MAG: PHP domain-containing protein [Candidatus Hodarchaeales archaeon]|jgi:histidinol phosphatase-like PHP family hydrolase